MKVEFGIEKVNVTPESSCRMGGYNRSETWTDVLDNIEVNACSLRIDAVPFILIELDSIMVSREFALSVKASVSAKTGVDAGNITVACIHTHSAPCYFKLAFEETLPEAQLTERLAISAVDAGVSAWVNRKNAIVSMETLEVDGLYGNRNVKNGPADKSVTLFSFLSADGGTPLGSVMFISAHPTILNGKSRALSADLIGQVRLRLESKRGCPVLCINGACGDVSTRFYRQGDGAAELMRTADELCDQIELKRKKLDLRVDTPRWGSIAMRSVYDAASDPDWKWMTDRVENSEANPMKDFLLKRQQLKRSMGKIELELPSQFAVIGNCIFITMPCDTCSALGLDFKRAFVGFNVFIIGYANTYCNYLVPREDYGKYFETFNSRTPRGLADEFVSRVIRAVGALL